MKKYSDQKLADLPKTVLGLRIQALLLTVAVIALFAMRVIDPQALAKSGGLALMGMAAICTAAILFLVCSLPDPETEEENTGQNPDPM